jgi:GT2 family glycosyltransferase
MSSRARIAVVVVNWNAGDRLRACLDSIDAHGDGLVSQVIVVDNGSTDSSAAGLEVRPGVSLVRAGANLGFGRACNLGARQAAGGDLLLFLNPDAALHAGTLAALAACLDAPANARVGICGVQLVDETGSVARSCSRLPSVAGLLAQSSGLDRLFPRLGQAMVEWDHAATRDVEQVIGAFFLVRRALFASLKGFDERFFVYYEEVDFSLRARDAGWRSLYLADVQAFHAGMGTTAQVKARRLFYLLRSRLLYAGKHFSRPGAVAVALGALFVEPLARTALALARGSWSGVRETWAACGMLWRWLLAGRPQEGPGAGAPGVHHA